MLSDFRQRSARPFTDPTRFLEREDPGELLRRVQRAVGIVRRAGWLREARVVIGREGGQERLGRGDARESAESELLHQAVLQGAVRALDAAFGLRAVGTEAVDVELAERAAELGETRPALGAIARLDVKDAQPIAVEGH